MEYEGDSGTNYSWSTGNNSEECRKETGRNGDQKKN